MHLIPRKARVTYSAIIFQCSNFLESANKPDEDKFLNQGIIHNMVRVSMGLYLHGVFSSF